MAFWSTKKPTTHTNAPRHWPDIQLDQFDNPGVNLVLVGAQLASIGKPRASRVAFLRDFLYEDGILRVPIVVEEGEQKTCVFVYSNRDANAAAHFSGVRTLLRSRENAGAVYYGPKALTPATAGDVLQPIDTPFFSKAPGPEQDAAFALWWATEDVPTLAGSDERSLIDRWFEAIDGYGFLLLTAFLKDLDLVKDKRGAYALPPQPLLQPLMGPGETRMLLHASESEGLFFAFDESTPASRRRVLLRLLADFAVLYRRAIEAKGLAPQENEKGPGLGCWRAIRDAALAKEAGGGTGLKLHAVRFQGGQPTRSPNATTAEDRAAQPQTPGREELDFGMDLLDRVIARLKNTRASGSTQAALGMPNFAPVIAAKVGADVFERRCPAEDAAEAQAAAARALDEWPTAEIVGVVVDAAIRENGKRTDVFDVKVENRASSRAGALFQRYRVGVDGGIELIDRPTAMPAESFLLDADCHREPAPDDAVAALARRALDTIVSSLTVIEPSGMYCDDAEEALLSPSALLGIAGDPHPHTVRFMLQGPIAAAMSCCATLQDKPAEWVVFHIDDLVSRNGAPDRRLRLCVQRRQDPGIAIFDQRYEAPRKGRPFALRGGLEFKRWGGSMF
jgi:hypothetical protein